MKVAIPPPAPLADMRRILIGGNTDTRHLVDVITSRTLAEDPLYHPWEWFFRHEPPEGFTREEWWVAVRSARAATARPLPLRLTNG